MLPEKALGINLTQPYWEYVQTDAKVRPEVPLVTEQGESLSISINEYLGRFVNLSFLSTRVIDTTDPGIISGMHGFFENIVNFRNINDSRYLNKYFEAVNNKLPDNGIFVGCAETKELRKKRILGRQLRAAAYLFYIWDFIIRRVLPKLNTTKRLYFYFTKGRNRVLTLSEILGRLVSCGFEIIDYQKTGDRLYFVTKKNKKPAYDTNPSYGPLVKLKRVGKNGKIINVYKLRTMHPYSEYLQDFIYNRNSLDSGGKFRDDFRITSWGKFLRKSWIDEIPMFYNWFKRELKLVGVRPISSQYFNLYPEEFRKERIKFKPGLIPPYYADLPKTLDEIVESERRYLIEYKKSPFKTDVKYFFMAFYNIIMKNARSN